MTQEEYEITVNHYYSKSVKSLTECMQKTAVLLEVNGKRKVCHLINFKDEDIEKIVYHISATD